jgi:hypothetical protein
MRLGTSRQRGIRKKNVSATNEKPAQIVKFMSTSGASKRFFGKIAGLNPGIKVSV